MPIFVFAPVDIEHPDWRASTHQRECRVHAETDEEGREVVADFFVDQEKAAERGADFVLPWLNHARARCIDVIQAEPPYYREGRIEVPLVGAQIAGEPPNVQRPWVAASEAGRIVQRLPPLRQSLRGDGGQNEEPHTVEGEARPRVSLAAKLEIRSGGSGTLRVGHPPVPPRIVRRVLRNRTVLHYQASALIGFLEELLKPANDKADRRNVSPLADALGVYDAEDADEILTVLRELLDELRRFNAALEAKKIEPETLAELRRVSLRALNVFALTVAGGTGVLFLAGMANFLDHTGLVPFSRFIATAQAVKPGGG